MASVAPNLRAPSAWRTDHAERRAAQDQDPRGPWRSGSDPQPRSRPAPAARPAQIAVSASFAPDLLRRAGMRARHRRPMRVPPVPLSLSPQAGGPAGQPRTRVASTNSEPSADCASRHQHWACGSGLSQRNEADAQASYRVLQGKFPSVLGSRFAGDQARRPRRQGRLLSRHGRSVRLRPTRPRSSAAT